MSLKQTANTPWIDLLAQRLQTDQYSSSAKQKRISASGQFLLYLQKQRVGVESAKLSDVQAFLQQKLNIYRKRHGRQPTHSRKLRL